MSIEVFNRYEYKYQIPMDKFYSLYNTFNQHLILDSYCKEHLHYNIINYYVDTLDFQMIRDSLDKPLYKQKLRLRTYTEITSEEDFIYFEIKKKYKGLVNKRRCKLRYKEALELIKTKELPSIKDYMNVQILNEIQYILKGDTYEIKNKITYDRIAFFSKDKSLRISFDFDILSKGKYFLNQNYALMEIKTPDSIPLWLVDLLNDLKVKKQSYSKYGLVYMDKLKNIDKVK